MADAAPLAFAYHRAVAPMMWVLVALSGVELLVVHLLVAHWSRGIAIAASLVTGAGIGWLALGIACFARRPVLLGAEALVWRLGSIRSLAVPRAAVVGLRPDWSAADAKMRTTLNLAGVAYPNVMVDLDPPIRLRRRTIVRLAHRLDDPGGFATALASWVGQVPGATDAK